MTTTMAWTWADFVLLGAFALVVVLTARYLLEYGVPAWSALGFAIAVGMHFGQLIGTALRRVGAPVTGW